MTKTFALLTGHSTILDKRSFCVCCFLKSLRRQEKKSRQISIQHSTFDYSTSAVSWLFRLSFKNCKFDNMHSALYIIFENIVDNRRWYLSIFDRNAMHMTSREFFEIWWKKRPLFSFDEAELESGSWKQCLIPNLSNLNISFQPPMEFYILSPISNRADSLICQISLEAIISIKLIAEIS